MMQQNMSEASMLREIIAQKDAEIASLKAQVKELEDKHWDECWQIAHYDDETAILCEIAEIGSEVILSKFEGALAEEEE